MSEQEERCCKLEGFAIEIHEKISSHDAENEQRLNLEQKCGELQYKNNRLVIYKNYFDY